MDTKDGIKVIAAVRTGFGAALLGGRHLPAGSRVGVPLAGPGAAAFGRMLISDLEE